MSLLLPAILLLPQIEQGISAWLHEHTKGVVEVIGSEGAMLVIASRFLIPDASLSRTER